MSHYLLPGLLRHSASEHPGRPAIMLADRTMTYSELDRASDRLAGLLVRNGVKIEDRVGLVCKKSIESIVGVFGVLKAGAVYVPIDPGAPSGRIRHILRNCGIGFLIGPAKETDAVLSSQEGPENPPPDVLITDIPEKEYSFKGNYSRIMYWGDLSGLSDEPVIPSQQSDDSPAYILHTSGSTGVPKGVVISHKNAIAFVDMAAEFFGIQPDDRLCNHASLTFDLSMFDIYVAIKAGAAIVLVPESLSVFPARLAEYIERMSITVWNSVSSVLSLLAVRGNLPKFHCPALRLVIFSGEILPVKYLRILKEYMRNASFFNIYGQTEANSSTYYRIHEIPENDAWKIPIGKPFPNFDVFVLDETGKVVEEPGGEGELYVKASTVAIGYWRDEQRTKERFIADPRIPGSPICVYRTGDIVRIDENGDLVFSGRKDHLVKSRGYRIELEEIEVVLNSHPNVRQAAAIPVPDEMVGNRILACVSWDDKVEPVEEEIIRHCSRLLPHYMVPESIRFYKKLPQSMNGKIDRKILFEDTAALLVKDQKQDIPLEPIK